MLALYLFNNEKSKNMIILSILGNGIMTLAQRLGER